MHWAEYSARFLVTRCNKKERHKDTKEGSKERKKEGKGKERKKEMKEGSEGREGGKEGREGKERGGKRREGKKFRELWGILAASLGILTEESEQS